MLHSGLYGYPEATRSRLAARQKLLWCPSIFPEVFLVLPLPPAGTETDDQVTWLQPPAVKRIGKGNPPRYCIFNFGAVN